ncbi:hypothetical protein SASPL_109982 [Salvia splendens]|uniref:Nuclease associated modular domain-containing protein n=1 Tax=Salvia splendens TaxID=180675 RepID=A0A8X8Y9L4_SALSN|nr:uncharacterized protein LOC121797826 [Salvia splendens]KAG6425778.1 hypothetical protein SASPL_109982 [Salvia splendens]
MPLLDVAISQPCSCFLNNIGVSFKSVIDLPKRIVVGNDRRLVLGSTFSGRNFCNGGRVGGDFTSGRARVWQGRLMIKAVGTLEIASVPCKSGGVKRLQNALMMDVDSVRPSSTEIELAQSSSEDSTDVDEREKLRRTRISKANKGNTPWNKGKKHSPETLRRIKERTRLAMQNPKVKAKLINFGHAQSEETRLKIGAGVRLGWEKRREKLMVQDTCYYDWQNLIAETARKGLQGEEQLQWDSYKILDKELQQQWQQSVEKRRSMPRPKGSKRAPKSAEQKRKISEAIAAKWADPDYRTRVYSGLAKYHGKPEGKEWKPKRKPAGDRQAQSRGRKDKDENDDTAGRRTKNLNQPIRAKRRKAPSYKDPLASTKLEMLKNIRAKRAAAVNNPKTEAITNAKSLIAEAEKAAKALEVAAKTSPLAHASLMESRMLIAEAHKLIKSIELEDATTSIEEDRGTSNLENEAYADEQNLELIKPAIVNGVHSIADDPEETDSFSFDEFIFADFINGNSSSPYPLEMEENGPNGCVSSVLDSMMNYSDSTKNRIDHKPCPNGSSVHTQTSVMKGSELQHENVEAAKKEANVVKKWVRGRLVEVEEEETS